MKTLFPMNITAKHITVHASEGLAIFVDGACEPNPGAGGWSYVVYRDGQEIANDCGGNVSTTNNQMELTGLMQALGWIEANAAGQPVTIWSDSRYTVDGSMSWRFKWRLKGWKKKGSGQLANLELWQAIDGKLSQLPSITVAWCKGHAGIPGNERADELASIGRAAICEDVAFLQSPINALDREYRAIMGAPL